MDRSLRLKFRPGDLIAAAVIAALALAVAIVFFAAQQSGPAEADTAKRRADNDHPP